MSCGNKLVTPNIQEGQELNGMLIHKIFKTKALYLRPLRTLLADSEEEKYLSTAAGSTDKDSDEDHCVFLALEVMTLIPTIQLPVAERGVERVREWMAALAPAVKLQAGFQEMATLVQVAMTTRHI
ncbi:hypothetical protein KUCAC02_009722 [Chaenocephalus aceratus]|uniref:Uncharacterized protein n=1 Tax=Chaenocephalus aceratus TaxID=36190 RepID=A0ACB9VYU3_CHAAC|nr:hypothetical protein KUCAC02_009722 [Chaenocephalus aceratus]